MSDKFLLKDVSPEATALPSIFALVLKAECEYFSNLAAEASSDQELVCQARTRALEAFGLRWKLPVQLDDAETWRSFLAATGSNGGAKRPVLRALSLDILSLILRNGRRVQWNTDHKGLSELCIFAVYQILKHIDKLLPAFDLEGETEPADWEDILRHLPIDSDDSAMGDHINILFTVSVRWLRNPSFSEMPTAKVTVVLQRMISAVNFISGYDRRPGSIRSDYGWEDKNWIEAVQNQVNNSSPYDNIFLQLHASERSYHRGILTGIASDGLIRQYLHMSLRNLHARADCQCKLARCSWKQHSCGGDEDNSFLGCPLLDADIPGLPSSDDYSFPEIFTTSNIPVAVTLSALPSDFDHRPTRPEDTHQSTELSVPADSANRTDDNTQEDPPERDKPASVAGHPLHLSTLQACSSSSATVGLSVGQCERAASGRSSAGLHAYDDHGVSEEDVAYHVVSSPAHGPGFLSVVSNAPFEPMSSTKAQPVLSDFRPDEEPMAHREPPNSLSDIRAEYTSPSEAQAEAEDHASTGETEGNSGTAEDRGRCPGLDEPVAHELASSDSPNSSAVRSS
ncbi:uncharacterized protein PHACADRAFT_31905 [Phanerochaete carnosa HHB-10118-sp]|uniref:Uncharacterized protein n=1 Tax=Phanerochaete carnosa (strain HHB-10118-sp) TaxID=650164 RepID=K5VZV7_PHACS|nr:uncharacterized protein PHACADRAFT_31905 [Phanerochaete carnosa HHB-10118-sp]EKM52159.1 hypothetical protein PHACADRAFT_31905 [Phanerochaete carnosa HHB-10118-sp]